jgi:hypothetical protein
MSRSHVHLQAYQGLEVEVAEGEALLTVVVTR